MCLVEGLPSVVVAVRERRELEAGDTIPGMKLQPHVVCGVERDLERIEALVPQYSQTLGLEAMVVAAEVVQTVEGRDSPELGEVVEVVAGAGLPVEPRDVGVSVVLDVPSDLSGGGWAVLQRRSAVVVSEYSSSLAVLAFGLQGGCLFV